MIANGYELRITNTSGACDWSETEPPRFTELWSELRIRLVHIDYSGRNHSDVSLIRYLCLAAVPGDGQYSDRDAVRCGPAPVRRINNFALNHGDHDAPSVCLSVCPSVRLSPDINARRSATLYPVKGSMTGSYKDCAQPT